LTLFKVRLAGNGVGILGVLTIDNCDERT